MIDAPAAVKTLQARDGGATLERPEQLCGARAHALPCAGFAMARTTL
ncbi:MULTISPECIES: hypothetical protein [unclassified Mesorhizobium]|nr:MULTISPECIES: hypothetical protein [unclassified Mesorhizobium]